jgi:hypothetical protein
MNHIPSEKDWGEYWKDFDQKSAFESFFGKSNEQMQSHFYKNGNELMSELRFMPPKPFKYYILGFRDFILRGEFPAYEASDFASYFLDMVEYLLRSDAQLISSSMIELMPALEYVANNQDKYEAPPDIYGDFLEKLSNIRALCEKLSIQV